MSCADCCKKEIRVYSKERGQQIVEIPSTIDEITDSENKYSKDQTMSSHTRELDILNRKQESEILVLYGYE
jgi:hypothetical protein